MQKVDYHRYMASREWALKKEAVKKRSGGYCERCKIAPMQNTHHLSYEHVGNEPLNELQGTCRPCHEYLSAKRNDDPAVQAFYDLINNNPIYTIEGPVSMDDLDGPVCITGWYVTEEIGEREISAHFNLRTQADLLKDDEWAVELEPGIYAICWWGM